jgi:hypothetical protein
VFPEGKCAGIVEKNFCPHTFGENMDKVNITQLAKDYGIGRRTVYDRIKRGMSIQEALTAPIPKRDLTKTGPEYQEKDGKRRCIDCEQIKMANAFYVVHRKRQNGEIGTKRVQRRCHECAQKKSTHYHKQIRLKVVEHYSQGTMKCKLCPEDRLPCLDLDHVFNNGAEERRKKSSATTTLYRRLAIQGFPEGYQILCRNCNWYKHVQNVACTKNN